MRQKIKNVIKRLAELAEQCLVCGSSGVRGQGCPICGNPIP